MSIKPGELQLSRLKEHGIDTEWHDGLVEGLAVVPDVDALVALAAALDVVRRLCLTRGASSSGSLSELIL